MMYPLDALKLARTKLRTRRVRLVVTVTTMSLLFAGLFFIATVLGGVISSLKSFGTEGLGSRYLVSAQPVVAQPYNNNDLLEALKPAQADLVARKKALAKKLGLEYDEKSDQNLPLSVYQNGPNSGDVQTSVNFMSAIATAKLQEQNAAIKGISYADFQKLANSEGAIHTYQGTNTTMGAPTTRTDGGGINFLENGKENFKANNNQSFSDQPTGLATITTVGWHQISDDLLRPFILDGQTTVVKDGAVPVIAPYSAAEQAIGLKSLPATATTDDKIARTVQLRKTAAGKTAQLCYRNSASQALLQKALSQTDEIAANKNNKDYTTPHLLYSLPAEACGPTTIQSDKRTAEEKKADDNQATFDATFTNTTPTQGIVTVRIVGIIPDSNFGASLSATSVLSGILSTTLGQGWFSPTSAFQTGTLATLAQDGTIDSQPLTQQMYYAEFPNLATVKQFIKSNNCSSNPATGGFSFDANSAVKTCTAAGTPYFIAPYGNNAGAIEDIRHGIWVAGRYVLLVVLLIASLIMMGTLGKIISDSRRETAVFRSLGATQLDIRQIYFTYAFLVSLLVIAASYLLGLLAASWLDHKYSGQLSASAVVAYNAKDVHKHFSLFGFDPLYIVVIIGLILVSAFLSAMIPLMANTRRNPIRDMRDES